MSSSFILALLYICFKYDVLKTSISFQYHYCLFVFLLADIGETKFHVMLSTGISPVGPMYKAASVKCRKSSTWLTASREGVRGHLDGQAILEEIYDAVSLVWTPNFVIMLLFYFIVEKLLLNIKRPLNWPL